MSISKSVRFEIFARDGFTCQYCGRRPPEVVLEVDHIHPQSKGGTDDVINLTTSCYDCNRGKRAKVLGAIAPRPDADMAFLKVQQENAEVVRFLKAKKKRDKAVEEVCEVLRETWARYLTKDVVPTDIVLVPWIERYGPDEIEKSIIITATAHNRNRFGYTEDSAFRKMLPYMGAVLRNRADDREAGAIQ